MTSSSGTDVHHRLTAALREIGRLSVQLENARAAQRPLAPTSVNDSKQYQHTTQKEERAVEDAKMLLERKVRGLQYELQACKKDAEESSAQWQELQDALEGRQVSVNLSARKADSRAHNLYTAVRAPCAALSEHIRALESVLVSVGVAHNKAVSRIIGAARASISECGDAITRYSKQRDADLRVIGSDSQVDEPYETERVSAGSPLQSGVSNSAPGGSSSPVAKPRAQSKPQVQGGRGQTRAVRATSASPSLKRVQPDRGLDLGYIPLPHPSPPPPPATRTHDHDAVVSVLREAVEDLTRDNARLQGAASSAASRVMALEASSSPSPSLLELQTAFAAARSTVRSLEAQLAGERAAAAQVRAMMAGTQEALQAALAQRESAIAHGNELAASLSHAYTDRMHRSLPLPPPPPPPHAPAPAPVSSAPSQEGGPGKGSDARSDPATVPVVEWVNLAPTPAPAQRGTSRARAEHPAIAAWPRTLRREAASPPRPSPSRSPARPRAGGYTRTPTRDSHGGMLSPASAWAERGGAVRAASSSAHASRLQASREGEGEEEEEEFVVAVQRALGLHTSAPTSPTRQGRDPTHETQGVNPDSLPPSPPSQPDSLAASPTGLLEERGMGLNESTLAKAVVAEAARYGSSTDSQPRLAFEGTLSAAREAVRSALAAREGRERQRQVEVKRDGADQSRAMRARARGQLAAVDAQLRVLEERLKEGGAQGPILVPAPPATADGLQPSIPAPASMPLHERIEHVHGGKRPLPVPTERRSVSAAPRLHVRPVHVVDGAPSAPSHLSMGQGAGMPLGMSTPQRPHATATGRGVGVGLSPVTAMVHRAVAEARDAAALARGDVSFSSQCVDLSSITGSTGSGSGGRGRGGGRSRGSHSLSLSRSRSQGQGQGLGDTEEDSLGSGGVGATVARAAAANRSRLLAGLSTPPQWDRVGGGGAGSQSPPRARAPPQAAPTLPVPGTLSTSWSESMSLASMQVVNVSSAVPVPMASPTKPIHPQATATSRMHFAVTAVTPQARQAGTGKRLA